MAAASGLSAHICDVLSKLVQDRDLIRAGLSEFKKSISGGVRRTNDAAERVFFDVSSSLNFESGPAKEAVADVYCWDSLLNGVYRDTISDLILFYLKVPSVVSDDLVRYSLNAFLLGVCDRVAPSFVGAISRFSSEGVDLNRVVSVDLSALWRFRAFSRANDIDSSITIPSFDVSVHIDSVVSSLSLMRHSDVQFLVPVYEQIYSSLNEYFNNH